MKIKFCTSPHLRHGVVLQNDFLPSPEMMYGFVPVGLLSLIACIRQADVGDAELFDTNRWINTAGAARETTFYSMIAAEIVSDKPDCVGFMTECDSYHHVLQICEEIKVQAPSTKVILGGPHASAVAHATLRRWRCIDAIAIGEGERSIVPMLAMLLSKQRASSAIAGVVYRAKNGFVVGGGRAPLIDPLDELPTPSYDLYRPEVDEEIFFEVGRGCPFSCTFCSTAPYWDRRHRTKSPEKIVQEIELLLAIYGKRRFHFTHDLFTTDRKWAMAVAGALSRLSSRISWTCSARADRVDPELLDSMAEGGCNAIYFGIESGSARVLSSISKPISRETTWAALQNCIDIGIQPNAGFIVGFPEDTPSSIRETFDAYTAALMIGTKPVHIFGYCPFAESSAFQGLSDMEGQQHFLDIPLPEELAAGNRRLVAGDDELFSSYRRPASREVKEICTGFIEGIDEFSPLVESFLLASLVLSEALGSMLNLYKRWLTWLEDNNGVGSARHRAFYGTPIDYGRFLAAIIAGNSLVRQDLADLVTIQIRSIELSSSVGHFRVPTDMATFRSLRPPLGIMRNSLLNGAKVRVSSVISMFASEWDLSMLVGWRPPNELPKPVRRSGAYVWQRNCDDSVRLLTVDLQTHELLVEAGLDFIDAATFWTKCFTRQVERTQSLDDVVSIIVQAHAAGLIDLVEA